MWVISKSCFLKTQTFTSIIHLEYDFIPRKNKVQIIIIIRYAARHFAAGGTTPKQTGPRRRHRTAADESSEILQLYLRSSATIEADPRRLLHFREAQH